MKLFGFEIKRPEQLTNVESFVPATDKDGGIVLDGVGGMFYHYVYDPAGVLQNETDLINRYRNMSLEPEMQIAIEEIVNEAISVDDDENVIKIVLDHIELPEKTKELIIEEFDTILSLLDFSNQAYDIFHRFYVDGKLNFHVIIDEEKLSEGIIELRYIDPRHIQPVKEYDYSKRDPNTGLFIKKLKNEYYTYNPTGANGSGASGFKIAKDSIARVTSGLTNENNTLVLSHLHSAIKPLNNLRSLEDATVIYAVTRAPERRVFYIDVGNLPKAKAEQQLKESMNRHKNRITYNAATGEITDTKNMMTMTEDYWFPRRGGDRTTEIDTIGGTGVSLVSDETIEYFKKKLYKSLKVPLTRLEPENAFSLGRTSEITRDELKFGKFIRRQRNRFSILFDTLLEKQLILKGILTPDEWTEIADKIRYVFVQDRYFEELKESEIFRERISLFGEIQDKIGVYFSRRWAVKKILHMTEEEFDEMKKEIDEEKKNGEYENTEDDGF